MHRLILAVVMAFILASCGNINKPVTHHYVRIVTLSTGDTTNFSFRTQGALENSRFWAAQKTVMAYSRPDLYTVVSHYEVQH